VIVGVPGIPEVYEMPRNLLDLTVTKRINKNISVRLSAQDLFNNPFRLLQDANLDGKLNVDNDQLMQYYKRGSYYTIGFSFRV
jgi:outer membrane receptor protein involved in Fe transport